MHCMCCSDTDYDQSNTWCSLRDLDLDSVTSADDVAIVRYLCSALSIRAAQIVAASMYAGRYFLTVTKWANVTKIEGGNTAVDFELQAVACGIGQRATASTQIFFKKYLIWGWKSPFCKIYWYSEHSYLLCYNFFSSLFEILKYTKLHIFAPVLYFHDFLSGDTSDFP